VLVGKKRLIYDGEHVGYRILFPDGKTFDMAIEDSDLMVEDFRLEFIEDPNISDLELVARGNRLEPIDNSKVLEMTYGVYAKARGFEYMENTDLELKRLYNHYNELCFDNKLPKLVAIEWSSRMTAGAGYCRRERHRTGTRFLIKLSTHYHKRYPNEVIDTLVHEMIHVLHPEDGHGSKFKHTMNDLNNRFGFTLSVRATGLAKVNYVYVCEDCFQEYERVRPIKELELPYVRCGVRGCKGSLYLDEDYTDIG